MATLKQKLALALSGIGGQKLINTGAKRMNDDDDILPPDILEEIEDMLYVFEDSALISPKDMADLLRRAGNTIKHLRLDNCRYREKIQCLEAENAELKQLLDQYQGCDYIAKLEQHIGELIAEKKELRKKIPQWVPVNDPPKKPGDYLTMNSAGFVQQEYFEKNWAMDVQYWMPLPEPPKEQSD